MLWPIIGAI